MAEIIQVSAHPVTPSLGMTAAAGAESLVYVRLIGHAVPATIDLLLKPSISSVYSAQYFASNGFWACSRLTAASS